MSQYENLGREFVALSEAVRDAEEILARAARKVV
jgi:hypothetical protein